VDGPSLLSELPFSLQDHLFFIVRPVVSLVRAKATSIPRPISRAWSGLFSASSFFVFFFFFPQARRFPFLTRLFGQAASPVVQVSAGQEIFSSPASFLSRLISSHEALALPPLRSILLLFSAASPFVFAAPSSLGPAGILSRALLLSSGRPF